MKVNLVSVEDSIITLGFRKMASFVKSIHPEMDAFLLPLVSNRSFVRLLMGKFGEAPREDEFWKEEVRRIAEPIAQADIVGFSSMTGYSDMTRSIISEVRHLNPRPLHAHG